MVSARYLELVVLALCLCLELFISGGLVVFVFTKELSVFIMCGGFMILRVCVSGFVEAW